MSQMLLTQANRNSLPDMNSGPDPREIGYDPQDAIAQVRYFWGGSDSFLATEYDGDDTLYGYYPMNGEWGYMSLSQMASTQNMMGGCERDYYFTPVTVREAINR